MHKFIHKTTNQFYYSSHCGNPFAEKENGLEYGTLKYIGEVKTNALGNKSTYMMDYNNKVYTYTK